MNQFLKPPTVMNLLDIVIYAYQWQIRERSVVVSHFVPGSHASLEKCLGALKVLYLLN